MRITTTQPLIAWEALEDSPGLQTLRELLASIPDTPLLNALRQARGKGRDDYPVSVLWGTLLLTIALRCSHTLAAAFAGARRSDFRNRLGARCPDWERGDRRSPSRCLAEFHRFGQNV